MLVLFGRLGIQEGSRSRWVKYLLISDIWGAFFKHPGHELVPSWSPKCFKKTCLRCFAQPMFPPCSQWQAELITEPVGVGVGCSLPIPGSDMHKPPAHKAPANLKMFSTRSLNCRKALPPRVVFLRVWDPRAFQIPHKTSSQPQVGSSSVWMLRDTRRPKNWWE